VLKQNFQTNKQIYTVIHGTNESDNTIEEIVELNSAFDQKGYAF